MHGSVSLRTPFMKKCWRIRLSQSRWGSGGVGARGWRAKEQQDPLKKQLNRRLMLQTCGWRCCRDTRWSDRVWNELSSSEGVFLERWRITREYPVRWKCDMWSPWGRWGCVASKSLRDKYNWFLQMLSSCHMWASFSLCFTQNSG